MAAPSYKQYPDKVIVNGQYWDLKFTSTLKDYGECHFPDREIVMRTKQRRTELMQTLIHEILHAFEFEYGIKIPHRVIYDLEHPICQFILQNFHWK